MVFFCSYAKFIYKLNSFPNLLNFWRDLHILQIKPALALILGGQYLFLSSDDNFQGRKSMYVTLDCYGSKRQVYVCLYCESGDFEGAYIYDITFFVNQTNIQRH